MPIYQAYNKKIGAWVKIKEYYGKARILNVKQTDPKKPFKGIPKRR